VVPFVIAAAVVVPGAAISILTAMSPVPLSFGITIVLPVVVALALMAFAIAVPFGSVPAYAWAHRCRGDSQAVR